MCQSCRSTTFPWAGVDDDPVTSIPRRVRKTTTFKEVRKDRIAEGWNVFMADVLAAKAVWDETGGW